MRLKRLELFGFKSFADRTTFDFGADTLTGVVGPNGCGKSNVVDAIRWVLGEQRAKSMRGAEMADVIFKGSSSRPSLSVAEATLLLDNTSNGLPGHGAEVSITRRVFKSGEGEYLVDGERVRLKDVREMLFDTGLGSRGYSVLEQGKIDAVLSANALERRRIFEEAAGISRYRQRKHEAELRLKRVDADLARLDDVLGELTTRVRSLKIQAGKAERFVEAKGRWTSERRCLLQHRLQQHDQNLALLRERLQASEAKTAQLRSARAACDGDVETREREGQSLYAELERLTAESGRLEGDGRALDERRTQLSTRVHGLNAAAREETERAEELTNKLEDREGELERVAEEALDAGTRAEESARELEQRTGSARELEGRYRALSGEVEEQNERVLELLHQKTEVQNTVRHLEDARVPADEREQRVVARLEQARSSVAGIESDEAEARVAIRRAEEALTDADGRRREIAAELEILDQGLAEVDGERSRLALERTRAQSRIEFLLDRERDLEALDETARRVLEELREPQAAARGTTEALAESVAESTRPIDPEELSGLVADRLRTGTEHARALDAVLGERAHALVLKDKDAALRVARWLAASERGQLPLVVGEGFSDRSETFASSSESGAVPVPVETRPAETRPVETQPADIQIGDSEPDVPEQDEQEPLEPWAAKLLAQYQVPGTSPQRPPAPVVQAAAVRTVANVLDDARALGRLVDHVTAEPGCDALRELLCGDVVVACDLEAALALAAEFPRSRFVTLQGELVDAAGMLAGHRSLTQGAVGRRSSAAELEAEVARLDDELEAVERRGEDLRRQRDEKRLSAEQAAGELDLARHSLSQTQGQLATAEARRSDLAAGALVLEQESLRIAEEVERLTGDLEAARERKTRVEAEFGLDNGKLTELAACRREVEGERDRAVRERATKETDCARVQEQLTALTRRKNDLERTLEETRFELDRARRLATEHGQEAEDGEDVLEQLAEQSAALLTQRGELEQRLGESRRVAEASREAAESVRRKSEGVTRELEANAEATTGTRLDLQRRELAREEVLERAREELALSPAELVQGFEPDEALSEESALDALDTAVRELKAQLDRLGPVNMEAMVELEEVGSRLAFLEGQRKDLAQAQSALRETIHTIDGESRRLFMETFDEVRGNFQRIFRQLFGGGRADVTLAEGEDVLDAGVEIVARPPGRELLSIALLSGGQRTMTALALLFAVFEARPSPFCVLDEVDAALDDANIERFLGMLDGYRSTTQFVVVTHNKGTMTACQRLYGVTMETKGVSRQVTVELDEVEGWATDSEEDSAAASGTASTGGAPPAPEAPDAIDAESGEPVVELVPARVDAEPVPAGAEAGAVDAEPVRVREEPASDGRAPDELLLSDESTEESGASAPLTEPG